MKIQALTNRLYERELYSDRHEILHMEESLQIEKNLRKRAETAYTRWLEKSYPDAKMYGYKSPITDHEKFMWIEGYIFNVRGRS